MDDDLIVCQTPIFRHINISNFELIIAKTITFNSTV